MESKHTKGEWKWVGNRLRNDENKIVFTEPQFTTPQSVELARANRQIIAEAGTVTNETGLTPRELQQSHAELLDACKSIMNEFNPLWGDYIVNGSGDFNISEDVILRIEQAIKKATK